MRTYGRQKGITMIGFVMLLAVLGFFAYGFMKLYPAYAEYFGVVKSMKTLQGEAGIENATIDYIRAKLSLQYDIQYVSDQNVPPAANQQLRGHGPHRRSIYGR